MATTTRSATPGSPGPSRPGALPGTPAGGGGSGGDRLSIGIIAPPWVAVPPPAYGGTETVLDALARALAAAGHEVVLFTTGDATCPVPRAWCFPRALGLGGGTAVQESRHVVEAYDALWGMDVIHDHTLVGPLYGQGLGAAAVLTTNHGPFNEDLLPLYRAMAGRVPVIAISHHQASTARDVPIAAVIHHGLSLDRWPVGHGEGGYALFLGRMSPDKGVDAAIAAARAAGYPLRIAAKMREPLERQYFEDRVAPLLGTDVEFVGEVGGSDKMALLGSATCLLNPIRWPEPFGMVMIEALACGTPVVTNDHGSAPEVVEHGVTGFVCDHRDPAALADALNAVGTLSRATCRRQAEQRFSAAHMADRHVQAYRAALGCPAERPGDDRLVTPAPHSFHALRGTEACAHLATTATAP